MRICTFLNYEISLSVIPAQAGIQRKKNRAWIPGRQVIGDTCRQPARE